MTSGGRVVDVGGDARLHYKYGRNKPGSKFLRSSGVLVIL